MFNFSLSKKNVLRGLHGDNKTWKLISCVYGKFFIAVVDFEKKSNSFLTWKSWELSHKNGIQLLIPPNYVNGHFCISDYCLFHYKLFYKGSYFGPKKQFALKWNDPKLNIKWPSLLRLLHILIIQRAHSLETLMNISQEICRNKM